MPNSDSSYSEEEVQAREEAARDKAIKDVADWISSAMASGLFGSDSWGLRKRIAKIVRDRSWETVFKNEEMRP